MLNSFFVRLWIFLLKVSPKHFMSWEELCWWQIEIALVQYFQVWQQLVCFGIVGVVIFHHNHSLKIHLLSTIWDWKQCMTHNNIGMSSVMPSMLYFKCTEASDVHWEFCWQQNWHRSSNICWIWAFAKKFFRLSALYLQHVKNIPCCFGLKFIFHLSLPTSVQQKCLFTLKALITTVSVKLLSHLLTRFRPKVESRKKRLCSIDCPKWRISAPQRLLRIKQEDVVHVDHSNDQVFSGNQVSKKRVMRN